MTLVKHKETSLTKGIVGSAGPRQARCMTSHRQPVTCYRKTKFSSNRHRKLQPFRETRFSLLREPSAANFQRPTPSPPPTTTRITTTANLQAAAIPTDRKGLLRDFDVQKGRQKPSTSVPRT
ncbi:hypothetical protein Trydic_g412 [Trypoxylus dichotomus]